MVFRYDDIDATLRNSIEKGVVAIRRINEHTTFADWMTVGDACRDMQTAAMQMAHANQPKGRGYNDAFKIIAEQVPDLAKLNKTTRNHAVWMTDPSRKQAIIAWHARLPANIRQEVNHPTTVWRRYQKDTEVPGAQGGRSPVVNRKDVEIVRLQEELDAANAKVRQLSRGQDNLTEGRDWTWHDTPKDIAAAWFRLQPTKAPQIASAILELAKSTTPKPKAKAKVTRPGVEATEDIDPGLPSS
jgi:hypothetical protein